MSGFFGIFNPKVSGIDKNAFEKMKKAADLPGHDDIETYVDDHIAIGHVMLRISPESEFDRQPLKSDCGNYILVGHFRLDYRDELGDKLGVTNFELEKTADSMLVMLSYLKWKEKCVHHLEGDWAFVIFELSENNLFLAKDKFGNSSLFYTIDGGLFYFTSSPYFFTYEFTNGRQINFEQLNLLSSGFQSINYGETLLKGFFYLKPSCSLSVNSSLQTRIINYFDFVSLTNRVCFSVIDDYLLELDSLLSGAVKNRLRTSNCSGIYLSAGIDSNTVNYFLLNEALFQEKNIDSYTSSVDFPSFFDEKELALIDERVLIKELYAGSTNLNLNFPNYPDQMFSDELDSGIQNSFFCPIVIPNSIWLNGIMRDASNKGIKRMFTGGGGNFTISWNAPNLVYEYILSFRFKELYKYFKHARLKYGKIETCNYLKRLLYRIFGEIVFFKKNIFKIVLPNLSYNSIVYPKTANQWMPNFKKLKRSLFPNFNFWIKSHVLKRRIIMDYANTSSISWYIDGSLNGIEIVDPTCDFKVVEFCCSIPESLFDHQGTGKYLIKKLMGDRIEKVVFNTMNYPQSYDSFLRFEKDKKLIKFYQKLICSKDLDYYLDKNFLKLLFQGIFSNSGNSQKKRNTTALLKNISLLNFYLKSRNFNA